jgi:hypothetical protein
MTRAKPEGNRPHNRMTEKGTLLCAVSEQHPEYRVSKKNIAARQKAKEKMLAHHTKRAQGF